MTVGTSHAPKDGHTARDWSTELVPCDCGRIQLVVPDASAAGGRKFFRILGSSALNFERGAVMVAPAALADSPSPSTPSVAH